MNRLISPDFLQLFCEKNSNGTKNLRLKGKELHQRFGVRLIAGDLHKIAIFTAEHPEIINLNLSYNDIGDDGLIILCDQIFNSVGNNIETLNLIHCNLSWHGIKKLAEVSANLKLKTLRLAGNQLGERADYWLILLLQTCQHLQYLDLGDTNQTFNSMERILTVSRFTELKILNISRLIPKDRLYQYDARFVAEDLAELLRITSNLEELHAQKCGFDGHDTEIIVNYGLYSNKTLKFLDLGYNNIADYGVDLLSNWLRTKPKLLALNIAGNKINNTGAVAISQGMPFSKIRFLDISDNRIMDDGMAAILLTIKKVYPMRIFYFWGNQFGSRTKTILDRLLRAKILNQPQIDVKLYCVDGKLQAGQYPANKYKHKYYDIMDYGCPVELLIKKNKIEEKDQQPRALIRFEHIERYPAL